MLGCNNKVAPTPEINALGKDALPRRGTELDLAPFSLLRVNKNGAQNSAGSAPPEKAGRDRRG